MKRILQFMILLVAFNSYALAEEVSFATKSVEQVQKLAEAGDASAQARLGWIYANGIGADIDADKAVEWYQKAAAQGYAKAQFELGSIYLTGEGVKKDATKAVEWYQKAAAQGLAQAQTSLGWMYQNGKGVEKDGVLAYAWHNLAAAHGNDNAKKLRDLTNLNSVQRAEAERLSANWKPGQVLSR